MKRFYKALVVLSFWLLIFNEGLAQLGEWTWVKGDSIAGRPGSFGTQLVPSPTNTPPSLYEPCEWTSLNKDFFYLFGGEHIGSNGDYWTNDLWRYNPSTNEWTWMKGNGLPSDTGNMGIQGVSSPNNLPPAATCAASWTDNAGDFWMYDGMSSTLYSSDVLWKYTVSTNEWTWIRGTKIPPLNSIPPVYGTQGVPGPANTPGNHIEGTSAWTDNAGDLWLFGGNSSTGTSNILWRYNVASNEWTWMKGAQNAVVASVYGNKGVEAPGNTPGARFAFSHWKDGNGNFWVYGGGNYDDLWRFNPSTNNWTWMNGNIAVTGSYGTQCIPSTNNTPGTKRENRAIWTDQGGNFWMFGGWNGYGSINDLWSYNLQTNNWTWVKGDTIINTLGNWGMLGVTDPSNNPKPRNGAIGWSDINGNLFMFGGYNYYNGVSYTYNDMWKFVIDPSCVTEINEISKDVYRLSISPNPATTTSTITLINTSTLQHPNTLTLFDITGRVLLQQAFNTTATLDMSQLTSGIYIAEIKDKEGRCAMGKVVKE